MVTIPKAPQCHQTVLQKQAQLQQSTIRRCPTKKSSHLKAPLSESAVKLKNDNILIYSVI